MTQVVATLDDLGRPAWIAVMVAGFILFWPIGLAILAYLLWSGRMGRMGCWRHAGAGWQSGTGRGRWYCGMGRGAMSGNTAFDEYRADTLRRLEEEQAEFIGFLDHDGYLHLTGREKELIIRGGVNISPVEIDAVLMQRAEIAEAATVGVPDTVWGEEVVSYVVLRAGEAFAPDDLLRHCAAHLPAFKAPKQILLREALPKSERGKLDRKALAAEWRSRAP